MRKTFFAVSALALSLGVTSGGLVAKAHAAAIPAQAQFGEGRWEDAPSEYREVQRMGFRDGIEAARRDFDRHSRKDADDHDSYKHPRVERNLVGDYRSGFREGYSRAMRHLKDEERHDSREYPR